MNPRRSTYEGRSLVASPLRCCCRIEELDGVGHSDSQFNHVQIALLKASNPFSVAPGGFLAGIAGFGFC
jgi:hypothetical protein